MGREDLGLGNMGMGMGLSFENQDDPYLDKKASTMTHSKSTIDDGSHGRQMVSHPR